MNVDEALLLASALEKAPFLCDVHAIALLVLAQEVGGQQAEKHRLKAQLLASQRDAQRASDTAGLLAESRLESRIEARDEAAKWAPAPEVIEIEGWPVADGQAPA